MDMGDLTLNGRWNEEFLRKTAFSFRKGFDRLTRQEKLSPWIIRQLLRRATQPELKKYLDKRLFIQFNGIQAILHLLLKILPTQPELKK
ncbi:hypothetical protein FVEN_g12785 [Fusarium venenatum]|uniref:Uncharacterized protein n=1 Tax=Fusarium venenatum TaxID=56646 RepID=A0A2L2SPQ6_9HYPO|nr:uncharacterized protein FVRRES_11252 [Fusarium venenatum]KAG8357372.1 hypothetical protein FVEN_g12785 [Fusarium venenatum]CEI38561.1 unnamed protein product [Fusarium venenatum]